MEHLPANALDRCRRGCACCLWVLTMALMTTSPIQGETIRFGSGDGAFDMEFVKISDVGNPPDTRTVPPMGAVDYEYLMAKFEVSCQMVISATADGIFDIREPQLVCGSEEDLPMSFDPLEATQYVNWLNAEAGYPPAYNINNRPDVTDIGLRLEPWEPGEPEYDPDNVWRSALARFAIPTADEWHKAAYYDPSDAAYRLYATGDATPGLVPAGGGTDPNTANYSPNPSLVPVDMAGGLSAYGTMGQTGNASEWEEVDWVPGQFGGIYKRNEFDAGGTVERYHTAMNSRRFARGLEGLRIVAVNPVPEPSSQVITALATVLFVLRGRRR